GDLGEAAPNFYGPLDGGYISQDREQDHEPLEGSEHQDPRSGHDSAGWRDKPLNEAADEQEHEAVRTAEDPTVRTALATAWACVPLPPPRGTRPTTRRSD